MEYAFLVQTCELPASGPAGVGGDRAKIIAEGLVALTQPLQVTLNRFEDGGWRVLSHDLLESNGSLIVSFLICRPESNTL